MPDSVRYIAVPAAVVVLLLAPGCVRHKYDNPITKDTQQPDKVLFDSAIDDIEKGRYERARLNLQVMMNTYDTSEYLAKAKLAVADSWQREGGAHGMAQAELEYKDFILFYPNMEEAAEAQSKICKMQFEQMDKADRDFTHVREAEVECKDVLEKFPNSKFAPDAAQMLRDVQEVAAEREFKVGSFYHNKGGNGYYASANRLKAMVDQYPIYSKADDALWMAADDYLQMGDRWENQQADMYTRIIRDYPLSPHVDDAKAQLRAMNRPIPEKDAVAEARMKYELQNRTKRGLMGKIWGPFSSRPDLSTAAKSGTPQMEAFHPTIPPNVPPTAAGTQTTNEIGITVPNRDIIDQAPEARANAAGGATGAAGAAGGEAAGAAGAATGTASGATPATGAAANGATNATVQTPADPTAPNPAAAPTKKNSRNVKQQLPPKPKRLPKPSKKKSTAAPLTTTPTDPTAKSPGGGGSPQAPKQ